MGRSSIAINSNYYILDHGSWKPTKRQTARWVSTLVWKCTAQYVHTFWLCRLSYKKITHRHIELFCYLTLTFLILTSLGACKDKKSVIVFRAGMNVYTFLDIKWKLDRELLDPLVIRNTIPLCMMQYERAFASTRFKSCLSAVFNRVRFLNCC